MADNHEMSGAPPGSPASAAPRPMGPGEYLRRRREAARLGIEHIADMLAGERCVLTVDIGADTITDTMMIELGDAARVRERIEAIEAHGIAGFTPAEHWALLDALQRAFRFDMTMYFALIGAIDGPPSPLPPVCRVCACSWQDACVDECLEPCDWAEVAPGEAPLCTMCIADDPEPGESLDGPVAAGEIEALPQGSTESTTFGGFSHAA